MLGLYDAQHGIGTSFSEQPNGLINIRGRAQGRGRLQIDNLIWLVIFVI